MFVKLDISPSLKFSQVKFAEFGNKTTKFSQVKFAEFGCFAPELYSFLPLPETYIKLSNNITQNITQNIKKYKELLNKEKKQRKYISITSPSSEEEFPFKTSYVL